ncbi:MAG: TIGR02996 domain-containing protein [Archangium sp.]
MSLEKAVAAKDEAKKLDALLAAWRKQRHPRIADVIDQVSVPLVKAAGGAVKAKNVPERTRQCIALLERGGAVDIGRVLATEWPGTWEPALPLVKALCAVADDPRVANEFARQIDRTQYDTWTSKNLWSPLFTRFDTLKDARQLPLLEAQLKRAKGEYYARDMRSMEERSVKVLQKLKVPKLSAADEKWLAQLEAPFSGAAAASKDKKKGGAELLAAVLAKPDDLGLRAVYGDWLTQHGDPRGELISLQLAAPSEKSEKRINSLIKKNWASWLGPLADWFTFGYSRGVRPPLFKAGFPYSGHVNAPKHGAEDTLRALLERPEWRTFEVLQGWPQQQVPLHEVLAHPNFARVRALEFAPQRSHLAQLIELAPPLDEMHVSFDDDLPPLKLERLKKLRRLSLHPSDVTRATSVLPQLDALCIDRVYADELTAEHWKLFEKSGVPAIDLGALIVSRERGAKHFTTLTLRYDPEEGALEHLPTTLSEFGASEVPLVLDAESLTALKRRLKRFPKLDPKTLPMSKKFEAPKQVHATLVLHNTRLLDERKVKRLWEIFTDDFGATLDTFQPNYASKRPLGDDPVEKLLTWSRNKGTHTLYLSREGGQTELSLGRDSNYSHLELPYFDADRFVAATRALVAYVKPKVVEFAKVEVKAGESLAPLEKKIRSFTGSAK